MSFVCTNLLHRRCLRQGQVRRRGRSAVPAQALVFFPAGQARYVAGRRVESARGGTLRRTGAGAASPAGEWHLLPLPAPGQSEIKIIILWACSDRQVCIVFGDLRHCKSETFER